MQSLFAGTGPDGKGSAIAEAFANLSAERDESDEKPKKITRIQNETLPSVAVGPAIRDILLEWTAQGLSAEDRIMKSMLITAIAFTVLVALKPIATRSQEKADPPDPRAKDAEPLPEAPKLDPKNNHVALSPDKTFLIEQNADKKFLRVLIATELCLREGPLEVFVCKKGTKEHEAILRVNVDAKLIHAALEAAGAKPGSPPQFINAKSEPDFKPATGTKIKVIVHYKKDGKLHTHGAQEWIWNATKKKSIEVDWVFAGSQLLKDPDNPKAEPYYGANSGEVISISNFPYSMLDLPIEISKDDAVLNFQAKTDRLPPLFSKVWLILEPVAEKK